jgi:hypothetical protein
VLYLSIRYHFAQDFHISAERAYKWCTDYDPQDPVLMHDNAERKTTDLGEGMIILSDTYHSEGENIEKQKLVILYPEKLSWVSTHISGPNRHSQFLYRIVSEGENKSHLEFTGFHVERVRKASFGREEISRLSEKLRTEDSAAWSLLAEEMERELKDNRMRQ